MSQLTLGSLRERGRGTVLKETGLQKDGSGFAAEVQDQRPASPFIDGDVPKSAHHAFICEAAVPLRKLPTQGDMALIGTILQFIGVFVSFSIAYVSFRGVRQTESSSLLRLATAFVFLGFGFLVEGVVGLGQVVPLFPLSATEVVVGGLLLETVGYFFLAFSHAIDVMLSKRMGAALLVFPVISLTGTQLTDILSFFAFYFVMYGVVETLYSYARTKRPDTLLIAVGLSLIGTGTFFQWLSILYQYVGVIALLQIILQEMGLLILFTPVLRFAVGGVKVDGTV